MVSLMIVLIIACVIIFLALSFCFLRRLASKEIQFLNFARLASHMEVDTGIDRNESIEDGGRLVYTRPFCIIGSGIRYKVFYIPESHHKRIKNARVKESTYDYCVLWLKELHVVDKKSPMYAAWKKHLDNAMDSLIESTKLHCKMVESESELHLFERELD